MENTNTFPLSRNNYGTGYGKGRPYFWERPEIPKNHHQTNHATPHDAAGTTKTKENEMKRRHSNKDQFEFPFGAELDQARDQEHRARALMDERRWRSERRRLRQEKSAI